MIAWLNNTAGLGYMEITARDADRVNRLARLQKWSWIF